MRTAVVGASGFVGTAVRERLTSQGHEVVAVHAPRVAPADAEGGIEAQKASSDVLAAEFRGVSAVVNCAGNPDASEQNSDALLAANAVSSAVVARAARIAGVPRLIQVSSAVVQGRRPCLDESYETEEFSPYAFSKAEGERRVRREFPQATVYRPPSVHAASRRVTSMTARIARSPIATVASPGDQPSPQALIGNVASAIAFLAVTEKTPPPVVIHPWEGLTAVDVMELLGGKRPVVLPRGLARGVCRVLEIVGRRVSVVAANARRVEMLWFGQGQASSWLISAGWTPPFGKDAWRKLGEEMRRGRP
ncbi:NAD-dependent epimerase/dehydratase family protein [Dietzia maris]|uniref:NAD-dependent epimerase/dehydratase family protein n=1 Tax=Dietzia maris TaxID=37915 RepID=UPI0035582283